MKISFDVQLREGRSGIEARSPVLKLTGHGLSQEDALESLKRGVFAWCLGLQKAGILESVLKRRKIDFQTDGHSIVVELDDISWVTN